MNDIHKFYSAPSQKIRISHAITIFKDIYCKIPELINDDSKSLIYTLGLLLRVVPQKILEEEYLERIQYFPHWLLIPSLWYANTTYTKKLLRYYLRMDENIKIRLLARIYQRKPTPITLTEKKGNRFPILSIIGRKDLETYQHYIETCIHWCIYGKEEYIDILIAIMGGKGEVLKLLKELNQWETASVLTRRMDELVNKSSKSKGKYKKLICSHYILDKHFKKVLEQKVKYKPTTITETNNEKLFQQIQKQGLKVRSKERLSEVIEKRRDYEKLIKHFYGEDALKPKQPPKEIPPPPSPKEEEKEQ